MHPVEIRRWNAGGLLHLVMHAQHHQSEQGDQVEGQREQRNGRLQRGEAVRH